MERLVTVDDMMERYGLKSKTTARKYLRQMFHYEEPLAAPMWAFKEWEERRSVMPDGISSKKKVEILKRSKQGRVIVPRTR